MMFSFAILLTLALKVASGEEEKSKSRYLISATSYLRAGSDYEVSVWFYNASSPDDSVNVLCQLMMNTSNYAPEEMKGTPPTILAEQSASFPTNTDYHTLTLKIPKELQMNWYQNIYLICNGTGAMQFHNISSRLTVLTKTRSLFIQTDKAVYKPGDKVLYRIFMVDHQLMPLTDIFNITIKDSQGNSVFWAKSNIEDSDFIYYPDLGMVSGKFDLTNPTPYGSWQIIAQSEQNQEIKTFSVEEYVLPKFEVNINLPSYILKTQDIIGYVTANYTHGEPLPEESDVLITITESSGWYCKKEWEETPSWYRYQPICETKTIKSKLGEGKVSFNLKNEELVGMMSLKHCGARSEKDNCTNTQDQLSSVTWYIQANVTDAATGKMISKTETKRVEWQNVRLQFMEFSPPTYKANLPYLAMVQLTQPDGKPPSNDMLFYPNGTQRYINMTYTLNCPPEYNRNPYPRPPPGPMPMDDEGMGPAPAPAPGLPSEPAPPKEAKTCKEYQSKPELIPVEEDGLMLIYINSIDEIYDSMSLTVSYRDPFVPEVKGDKDDKPYRKFVTAYKYVNPFKTSNMTALQISIELEDGMVKADTTAEFKAKLNKPTQTIHTELMSKGRTVYRKTWNFQEPQTELHLPIEMDNALSCELSPNAKIYVWFISEGELIADSVDFSVECDPLNKVSVTFDRDEAKPGETVDLTVSAAPESLVAVLGVDMSVQLLKGSGRSSDVTQEMVDADMREYDPFGRHYVMPFFAYKRKKRSMMCIDWCWPWFSRANNVQQLLNDIGMIVLTDIYIYEPPRNYYGGPVYRGMPGESGPMAESGTQSFSGQMDGSSTTSLQEVERTRTLFPETWLWLDEYADKDGKMEKKNIQVPDTITSWVVSSFALSKTAGLGIGPETAKLKVFQPFFITLSLPYSVIRGESFLLNVTVFNYMQTGHMTVVTLENSPEFKSLYKTQTVSMDIQKSVYIEADNFATVSYWIIPQVIGNIKIVVKAQTEVGESAAADRLERILLVEAEGTEEEYCESVSIKRTSSNSYPWVKKMRLQVPTEGFVQGSEKYWISVIGDQMGNSIKNLDKLVRMPTGCGEQNMVGFVPNIFVMQYMDKTKQVKKELLDKLLTYMKAGYQRELSYKWPDYSYSAFGARNGGSGSTWLTAFVCKSYTQASYYIPNTVDMYVVKRGAEWILGQQSRNGSFFDPGSVHSSYLKGGSSTGIALTAFVVLALVEIRAHPEYELYPEKDVEAYDEALRNAVKYLEGQLGNVKDNYYDIAIVTYALLKAKSGVASQAMIYLKDAAIQDAGMMYWAAEKEESSEKLDPWMWWRRTKTFSIEATGYAILAYVEDPDTPTSEAFGAFRWLITKSNSQGGFMSTQDTVLGIQAMTEFAMDTYDPGNQNLRVEAQVNNQHYQLDPITSQNAFVLQTIGIDSNGGVPPVLLTAKGTGVAVGQVCASYHVTDIVQADDIVVSLVPTVHNQMVILNICFRWDNEDEESGMAMIEASPISGYTIDTDGLFDKYKDYGLSKLEMRGKTVAFYWEQFTIKEQCIDVSMYMTSIVADLQQAQVKLYAYYTPDIQKTLFYKPILPSIDPCKLSPDFCEQVVEPEPTVKPPPVLKPTETAAADINKFKIFSLVITCIFAYTFS